MRRLILALTLIAAIASTSLIAHQTQPTATEQTPSVEAPRAQGGSGQGGTPQAVAPAAPQRAPTLSGPTMNGVNIRLEITITDTFGGVSQKKSVAMTMLSGASGMIRTSNSLGGTRVSLNVDGMATAYPSGQIPVRLTVSYQPLPLNSSQPAGRDFDVLAHLKTTPAALEESITVVLTDGKPLVLTESADPVSDRKVTLQATATILK